MKVELKNDLNDIDRRLQVHVDAESIMQAVFKEFGITRNCAKGKGGEFYAHLEVNHPGALLFHAKDMCRSRQDTRVKAAVCSSIKFQRKTDAA